MIARLPRAVRWATMLGIMLLSASAALGTQQPIEVRVSVAERQTAYRRMTYGARLRPRQTVNQRAPQSGLVDQITVQPGQVVARGDLLMSLRRNVPTDSFRPVPVQSFHDGVIASIAVYEGQEVRDGDTLLTIADTSSLTAELLVSDKDIDAIRVGAPVTAVDSQRDRTFSGRVTRSALIPDYATGLFSVEVSVNPGPGAFVGQFLRFSFRTDEISAILVAREHLEYRGGRYHLFVVENGRAVLRPVTLGAEYDSRVVIRDGLHEGERYVISAVRRLQDGASVTVRE
ncbi:MAG: HlyD family efflux transporter periplasmic adaptor subunit [Spirochaetaceae bacterium]|nr:MAG: HlyD family efflux transporter periplasmic adaptor subunit [Spirochaetaceae bacterium]